MTCNIKEPNNNYAGYEIEEVEPNLRYLTEYVYKLQGYYERGIKKCLKFGDVILYPGIEYADAWNLCGGMSIAEFKKRADEKEKLEFNIKHRRDLMSQDDLNRIEDVKKLRNELEDGRELIKSNIISGLKFMAENKDISQDEFVQGLKDRGCVFTVNDIYVKYPRPFSQEKFRDGEIGAGAYVLACARDSKDSRDDLYKSLFSVDNDYSVYGYIREATGDKTYTKEYVDSIVAKRQQEELKKVK